MPAEPRRAGPEPEGSAGHEQRGNLGAWLWLGHVAACLSGTDRGHLGSLGSLDLFSPCTF